MLLENPLKLSPLIHSNLTPVKFFHSSILIILVFFLFFLSVIPGYTLNFVYKYNDSFLLLHFRSDSPKSSMRIAWCTILSRTASAIVFSPITSYQSLTGTCDVMTVDFLPCLSSMMSIRFIRPRESKGCMPKSSNMSMSNLSIFLSSCRIVPFALATLSIPISLDVLAYKTLYPFWQAWKPKAVAR